MRKLRGETLVPGPTQNRLTKTSKIAGVLASPWAMVLAGLAMRLVVMAFVYSDQLDPARDHFAFGFEMGRVARSITSGQGFSSPYPEPTGPTALVAPAYPYLLAGVFRLFGVYTAASALAILTLNNLFSALTCLPVFHVARLVFGHRAAHWAGWAWAFFPYAVGIGNIWIWETSLTTLLLTLLLLATLHLADSGQLRSWIGYGLLWGVTVLSNPAVLSVMPFLWIWVWYKNRLQNRRSMAQIASAAGVFIVCLFPWLLRNYRVFGRVVLRSNFGLEVLVGNDHDSSQPESATLLPADNSIEMAKIRSMGETDYMEEKTTEALRYLKRHPGRFAEFSVRRFVYTWTGMWGLHPGWTFDESGVPHVLLYTGISVLALLGLWRGISRHRSNVMVLAIVLVFYPLVYYLTHTDVRYRHPIDPVIVILAAYGASRQPQEQVRES